MSFQILRFSFCAERLTKFKLVPTPDVRFVSKHIAVSSPQLITNAQILPR